MSDPRLARPLWRGRTNVDALTIACIEHAEQIMRDEHPAIAHNFVITQGSYQAGAGDPLSAGTHDRGGVVDAAWCGHPQCILALRGAGTTASHRKPSQGPWPDHIHLVVIGHPDLAPAAADQVDDYVAGRNGLSDNGPDDGPRLNPIPRPVWPWPPEDPMADYAAQLDRIERKIDRNQDTLVALRKNVLPRVKELEKGIDDLESGANDDATKRQVARLRAAVDALAADLTAVDDTEA